MHPVQYAALGHYVAPVQYMACCTSFSCVWCIPQPPQVVETSCPIKGVMCTRKGMHKECNKSVVTQLTLAHMGYIGSVVPLPSRPAALGPRA